MNDEESQQLKEALALSLVDTGRASPATIQPPSQQPRLPGREDGGIPPQAHSSPTNSPAPTANAPAAASPPKSQPELFPSRFVAQELKNGGSAAAAPAVGPSDNFSSEDGVGPRSGEIADSLSQLDLRGSGGSDGYSRGDRGGVGGTKTQASGLAQGEEGDTSGAAAALDSRPASTEEQHGASSSGQRGGASA
jgi:hypothetical protein